jgi:hypothetical protein
MAGAALALKDFESTFNLGSGVGGLDLRKRGQGRECRKGEHEEGSEGEKSKKRGATGRRKKENTKRGAKNERVGRGMHLA